MLNNLSIIRIFKAFINFINSILLLNSKSIFFIIYGYSLYSLFSYFFNFGLAYAFFRIPKMSLTFSDIRSITYSSGCNDSIINLKEFLNCDPYGRPFNYPRLILDIFKFFHINSSNTEIVGFFLGLTTIFAISIYFFKNIKTTSLKFLISSLFLFSLPVQLVIERANYDSLIMLLMLFIPFLINPLEQNKKILLFFSFIISFISIKLKIFPFSGLFLWNLFGLFKFRYIFVNVLALMGYLISILFTFKYNQISRILGNTPKPTGDMSFGIFALHQNYIPKIFVISLFFLKVFFIFYFAKVIFLSLKKIRFEVSNSDKNIINYFFLFSFQFLSLYFLFSSWDYRLIFLIGTIPLFTKYWYFLPKRIGFLRLEIIPYMSLFVFYQQYLPYGLNINLYTSFFSDLFIQPILVGMLCGINLYLILLEDSKLGLKSFGKLYNNV